MSTPHDVVALYQDVAEQYDLNRGKTLFEKPWLQRCLEKADAGDKVLDLGCGAGRPIGQWLAAQGYAVTGVDAASAMTSLFAAHVPSARVLTMDMRQLEIEDRFQAIIGWGSLFHLSIADQRQCLPRILRHLAPGGRVLLTVGTGEGEAFGTVAGRRVYHASLDPQEYRDICAQNHVSVLDLILEDPDCHGHSLLLGQKQCQHLDQTPGETGQTQRHR